MGTELLALRDVNIDFAFGFKLSYGIYRRKNGDLDNKSHLLQKSIKSKTHS